MNRSDLCVLLVLLNVALAGCASSNVDSDHDDDVEVAVTLEQVPPAVKTTLLQASTGGRIGELDRVTDDGQTTYEADLLIDGKKWEVVVLADGTLSSKKLDDDADGEDDNDERDDD